MSHRRFQRSLDWTGRADGLASQVTGPHTPLDVFPWVYMKTLMYSSPVDSEEDLIFHIIEAATTIQQKPNIFKPTRKSVLRRCVLCTEAGGHTFGHLL